jgi:peptidoglycan/LPS O-acetylase OafA/YrhL
MYFLCGLGWLLVTLDAVAGGNRTWFTRFLSHPFFQVYGKLSFGLYLLHSLAIWMQFASAYEFVSWTYMGMWCQIAATVGVTSVFAYMMYFFIDRPVSKFCNWLGRVTGAGKKKKPTLAPAPAAKAKPAAARQTDE